jgi:hypothetical protein
MSDNLVMTSTTQPAEELEHAVSDSWRELPEEKPAEVPPKPEEQPPAEEPPEGKPSAPKEKDHKSGWQKRIDKLTARNHALENRIAELEAKVTPAEQAKAAEPTAPTEPKLNDYKTVEEFLAARDAYKDAKELHEAQQEQQKAINDAYNLRASQIQGEIDDWSEVVSASQAVIPQPVVDAVKEMDNGPAVAYYLATHEEEAAALMDMTATQAIRAVGKISDQLVAQKATPPKVKTKPPEPLSPVGQSATKSSLTLDQIPIKDYIKIRNKQERESRLR